MRVSFYSAGLFRGGFCLKVTQILLTYYFFRVGSSHTKHRYFRSVLPPH